MTPRAARVAAAISVAVLLAALSQRTHFENAFRVSRLVPVPVNRGEARTLCYGDFDGDGADEEVQLFTSGLGAAATSRATREVRWEYSGSRRYTGAGFLPERGALRSRVWLRYENSDSLLILFLDPATGSPADTICLRSSQFGPGDPFRPRNGAFDGSVVPVSYVELPGPSAALMLEFRCGRNLMPRGLAAWDLIRNEFAWRLPLGPTPGRSDYTLYRTAKHPEGLWIFGTIAPSNGAVGSGIPDSMLGVIAVTTQGEIAWWKPLGAGFGKTVTDVLRTGSEGPPEVLVGLFGQAVGNVRQQLMRLDIDTGEPRDSISVKAGPMWIVAADVNGDGLDEAIVSYDDGVIETRGSGRGLPLISRAAYAPGAEVRLSTDLNGDGRLEVVVADSSGVTVADGHLKPMAHSRLPEGMRYPPAPRLIRLASRDVGIAFPEKAGPIYRFSSQVMTTPLGVNLVTLTAAAAGVPWMVPVFAGWIKGATRKRAGTPGVPRRLPALFAHFEVTEKLGSGGRGVVYRAVDTYTKRVVALKFIRTELMQGEDPEHVLRFRREAQIMMRLSHPGIPAVYEHATADGLDYIAMEYIEGRTMDQRLKAGKLPVAECVRRTRELASALAAAHAKGVVHRDMKPGNVMISSAGETKLLDFGLGWMTVGSGSTVASMQEVTQGRFRGGTLRYVSPELALGHEIDHRADIYGLGMILFEAATGVHPYPSNSLAEAVYAAAHRAPPRPSLINSEIEPGLEAIVLRCLAKEPERRYESAHALLEALEAWEP